MHIAISYRLIVLLYAEVVELPSAFLLQLHAIGLAAIDATIVEIVSLNLAVGYTHRLDQRDVLHRAADDFGAFARETHRRKYIYGV